MILVIGDIMLDRYWQGEVTRLSQEAPVPVVKMGSEKSLAGAAANVAANVAALGSPVTLIGIVGKDESGEAIHNLAIRAGVNPVLVADESIHTTQKLRVIGRKQQIVRIDFEMKSKESIETKAIRYIENHDIIVFSDYGKGALSCIQTLIGAAKSMNKTVLIDPKGHDYSKYAGADLIKPNVDEMREIVGGWGSEDQLLIKANKLREEAGVAAILLTRAADGMTLFNGQSTHIHAKAKEVYDVTGAGDTVMAALAVNLADGRSLLESAIVANYAAGIAVGKFGTAVVTTKELQEAMNEAR